MTPLETNKYMLNGTELECDGREYHADIDLCHKCERVNKRILNYIIKAQTDAYQKCIEITIQRKIASDSLYRDTFQDVHLLRSIEASRIKDLIEKELANLKENRCLQDYKLK